MARIKRIIEIMKEAVEKAEREEREKEHKEWREKLLEGYVTKDGDYVADVFRDRIKLDFAYATVSNILIEKEETLTDEEKKHYEHQKQTLEEMMVLYYMREKGWTNNGSPHIYRKEIEE